MLLFDYMLDWEYFLSIYNSGILITLVGKGSIHRDLPGLVQWLPSSRCPISISNWMKMQNIVWEAIFSLQEHSPGIFLVSSLKIQFHLLTFNLPLTFQGHAHSTAMLHIHYHFKSNSWKHLSLSSAILHAGKLHPPGQTRTDY